jgi:predicted membrane protein
MQAQGSLLNNSFQPKELRNFGYLFVFIFSLFALWPLFKGAPLRLWPLVLAVLLFLVTQFSPQSLAPVYKTWMAFAAITERVMNPLIMGVIFYLMFTPIALVLRILGRDALRMRLNPEAKSYWIRRETKRDCGPGMKFQF